MLWAGRVGVVVVAAVLAVLPTTAAAQQEYVVENPTHYWRDRSLTWSLRGATADVSLTQQTTAIQAALDSWAHVSQLTFTQVDDCQDGEPLCTEPDLRVWFTTEPHFQGPGDTEFNHTNPGHAIYPLSNDAPGLAGDIHLDDDFTWRVDGTQVPDIQAIVTHEAGHALGLRHADHPQTGTTSICPATPSPTRPIMCPLILGVQHDLAPDDIAGIQSFYGRPAHTVDATIRRNTDRAAIGAGLVNTSAAGQSSTFSRARTQRANFLVRVTNEGTEDDVVTLRAPTAPSGYGYRYYVGPTGTVPATNITRTGYEAPLAAGAGVTIRVEVTVKATAVRNRSQGLLVRSTSQSDPTRVDVVRAIVKVT